MDPKSFDSELDRLLAETADEVFVRAAGADGLREPMPGGIAGDLWQQVTDLGFPGLGTPEELGGAGGSVAYLCTVVRVAAGHAAQIPLAPAAVAWSMLADAGLTTPEGVLSVAAVTRKEGGVAVARRVPYGRHVDHLVVGSDDQVAVVPRDALTVVKGLNLAGEPHDDVSFATDEIDWSGTLTGGTARARERAALVRSAAIVGALDTVERLVVRHVGEREQFGTSLARLPVVRDRLAVLAESVSLARAAVDVARLDPGGRSAVLPASAAKVVASKSAGVVARLAHQLHGAVGVTAEHPLHHFTLRLLAWRDQDGTAEECAHRLGATITAAGPERLWASITDDQ